MTKLRISRCDAVVAQNEVHHVVGVKDRVIQLLATNGDGEIVSFTHDELAELINNGTFTIIYGYFSDRLVARRAIAGRALLDRLPTKQKWLVLWKEYFVRTFLEAEKNGEVSRSDVSFSAFRKELHRRVNDLIMRDLKKPNFDKGFAELLSRRAPCRGSVMKWVRLWSPSKDPMTLVKRSMFNAGNAKNIGAECEAVIQAHMPTFLSTQRIHIPALHNDIITEIGNRNKARKLSGHGPLREVSISTVERRVKALGNFEIIAARKGLSVAKNKLGAHTGGIDVWAALQRLEMDEWQIDLMAILSTAGVDFTDERFRDIEIGRYWVCVAMDAASRSILGIKLSKSPSAEDAKAVLWMAMRDKSQISKQLDCETTWKQHGHVHHVIVDNGAAFVDAEFKACLSDLSIEYDVLPAGVPKLRGRIERLFLTLAKMLMPYLTGRTFSNPQERGEYPSEKYAVHTADSIIELLVRFVVDAYHLRSHRGLEHATPNDEWDRLCDKFGWSPPRDRHVLRHALGISYKRRSGRHGVMVCGVNFHSRELERHFKQHAHRTSISGSILRILDMCRPGSAMHGAHCTPWSEAWMVWHSPPGKG